MRSAAFWEFFDKEAAPKLSLRADSFRLMFQHLDRLDRPAGIVETGCARIKDNWAGDGQSTVLFDRYAKEHPGCAVFTVDIEPAATAVCRSMVSDKVAVHTGDSVAFLGSLVKKPPAGLSTIDLLYLDSVDVDMFAPQPSAIHHLKELLAISPMLTEETLVVVDDSPSIAFGYAAGAEFKLFKSPPRIGGKGMLIGEYAEAIGVKPLFTLYQCGWLGLGRSAPGKAKPV